MIRAARTMRLPDRPHRSRRRMRQRVCRQSDPGTILVDQVSKIGTFIRRARCLFSVRSRDRTVCSILRKGLAMKRVHPKDKKIQTEVLNVLCERFPRTFFPWGHDCKPLKIGIDVDLNRVTGIGKRKLNIALARYTSTKRYLEALIRRDDRVDLNGDACGKVSDHQNAVALLAARARTDMDEKRISAAISV